ncbi:hypothetical protein XF24_00642 [candidate division SR1 bacterium Aalborg_AAW-1]|nr:hypothetical protein XF24_00642 [candidate division SR1 bacterium Aalborg_AAW-1]
MNKELSVVFPLYENEGETFVLLGKNGPATKMPGLRNGFGGKCEIGESVLDCAIRETQEETAGAIVLSPESLFEIGNVYMSDNIITFFTTYLTEKISIQDTHAMIDIQWFSMKNTSIFLHEMLSGDDQVIQQLSNFIDNKEQYIPFRLDKTNDSKLAEQTKNIYS